MTMTEPEIPTAEPATAKEVVELREELTALREELSGLMEVMYAIGAVAQVAVRPTPFAQGTIRLFSAVLEDGPPDEEHLGATATRVDDPEPAEPGLAARVEALESRLDELVESLASEVRTRRLVVVDEHGEERITTFVTDSETELIVGCHGETELQVALTVSGASVDKTFGSVSVRDLEADLAMLVGWTDRPQILGEPVHDRESRGLLEMSSGDARSTCVNRATRVIDYSGSTIYAPGEMRGRGR